MKIAILGWGSLIWDPRKLATVGEWQTGGPVVSLEFSRISMDGRLTLVIDEANGEPCPTRYIRSIYGDLNEAIWNLGQREGTGKRQIGFVSVPGDDVRLYALETHPKACAAIKAWAKANDWEAVIWTALGSNFEEKQKKKFTVERAKRYLESLDGDAKTRAMDYIERAPSEVETPFRRVMKRAVK